MDYGCIDLITRDGRAGLITRDGHVTETEILRTRSCESSSTPAGFSDSDQSKFRRFLHESFPNLGGPQLEALSTICLPAYHSEEFFLCFNVTDQLVRTAIGHENLCSDLWIEANDRCKLISHTSMLWAVIRDEAYMRVHFPSFMLKEAFEEGKTLKTKLFEWKGTGKCCQMNLETPVVNELEGSREIEFGGSEEDGLEGFEDANYKQPRTSKLFWQIQAATVKYVKDLTRGTDGIIKLVTWRGGEFVQKINLYGTDTELKLVKWFSHPHIVYSFGEPCDGSSYFMEYIPYNLYNFIRERINRNKVAPPFSHDKSIDILSQIAEAMRYMHEEKVVHCDLKCSNILIKEILTSNSVKHYLVKVADFGSSRLANPSGFIAGVGSTAYSAPEALMQQDQRDRNKPIREPNKIDVYSFGVTAFEILTGKDCQNELCRPSRSKFKEGVINGSVRPLLRDACLKDKELIQNEKLISLIEKCWHNDPSERPSFVGICQELNNVMQEVQEKEQMSQNSNVLHQVHSISSAPEVIQMNASTCRWLCRWFSSYFDGFLNWYHYHSNQS